jgi:hypothetical protein
MTTYSPTIADLSKIHIAFHKQDLEARTRESVERSIATLVKRSVEAHARSQSVEAELTKLSDSINAPLLKLLESDPAAKEAVHVLQNQQLLAPADIHALHPESPFVGGGAMSAIPPFDFSWSWQGGAAPFNQQINPPAGYVGIDARSGSVAGGASGVVNAHAGYGVILPRVSEVMHAQASGVLAPLRFFYTIRAVGIGSNATTEGGAEVTLLENGQLIASASSRVWRRRISANESGSDSQRFDRMDVPPPNAPLRFTMVPGREYAFNIGFWAFTDRSPGFGAAGVQGLVEGNATLMQAGWGSG